MRLAALLWLLGACTMCLAFPDEEQLSTSLVDPQAGFQIWMKQYDRSYSKEEQARRFPAWEATLQYVQQHRAANELHAWTAGLTEWADWTDDEFRAALLGQRDMVEAHEDGDETAGDEHGHGHQNKHHDAGHGEDDEAEGHSRRLQHDQHHKEHKDHEGHHKEHKHHQHDKKPYRYENSSIPDSVNWPEQGIVSPIKNQHVNGSKCGCCWSFASVAVAECLNNMANKNITSLSEQQLIDCDHKPPYVDGGCEGGDFIGGLWYIINNGGIDNDTDYPYEAKDDKCQKEKEDRVSGTLDGVEDVPRHNETALAQAVTHHPVGVGICVGPYIIQWRAYTGGVFDIDGCHKPIDHGMVVVGYGSENGTDYWLLKNSWGETFGEKGYMKVPKGLGGKGWGALAGAPAYPLKKGVQLKLDSPAEMLEGPGQHSAVQQA